jgi:hypothetical protein
MVGEAIENDGSTLTLESCIFSGNQTSSSSARGGAIYNTGDMTVKGCTFYNNTCGDSGGAIYHYRGMLTLTGNVFYGNTASVGKVVFNNGGTVTSNGYNSVDVALGTETNQSGWTSATGDRYSTTNPFTDTATLVPTDTVRELIPASTWGPTNMPATDFNGVTRTWPGAPGAVR